MKITQVSRAAITVALLSVGTVAAAEDAVGQEDKGQEERTGSEAAPPVVINASADARIEQPNFVPKAIDQVARSEILVTGTREELLDVLSPGAVSVIYPDDTRGEHKALPDLLDQIPGVFVRRVAGTGQYTTTSIRGSAPSQVNIYIDGVPYNTSSEVAADISTIPIGNVERIEVYRGTVPARFSGAPLGGAINIVTKRATELSGSVSGGARSFGGWQAAGNINIPLAGGSLLLGADAEGSDGDFKYKNYGFEQLKGLTSGVGPDGLPNTYYDQYDYYFESLNMGLPVRHPKVAANLPVERTRLNNSFERYNGLARWTNDHFDIKYSFTRMKRYQPVDLAYRGDYRADSPAYAYPLPAMLPGGDYDENIPSVLNPRRRQIQEQHDVALGWHDRFGELEVSASLNMMDQTKKYRNLELVGLNGLGAHWSDFRTRRYGAQLDLAYRFGQDWPIEHYLELHVQGSQETMYADANGADQANAPESQAAYYQRFRRHLLNIQAQDTITVHPLGNLQITPILRVERLWGPILGPKENIFGPSSGDYDWLPTFSIGAKKDFGDWQVFVNTGTYNRYPNFYEIYGDGLNVQAGSSFLSELTPLRRESGRNSDIGIGWNGTVTGNLRASFRTTLFARKNKNAITYYATPAGSKYINSGTTLTRGIELEGNLILGDRVDIQAAYTYLRGRYVKGTYYWFGGNSALDRVGDNPLYTVNNPRQVANARINTHFLDGALTLFGEITYTGKRYTYQGTDADGDIAFSYERPLITVDFGGHYEFGQGFNLSLGVNDVFNAGPKQRFYDVQNRETFWNGCGSTAASCRQLSYSPVDRNVAYPQQGRTFYLTLAKHFGPGQSSKGDGVLPAASGPSWTGFYVGGTVGRGSAPTNSDEVLVFDGGNSNLIDGTYDDYVNGLFVYDPTYTYYNDNAFQYGFDGGGKARGMVPADGIEKEDHAKLSYSFRAGYDQQVGNWLVGGLLEWSSYRLDDSVSGYGAVYDDSYNEVRSAYVFSRRLNSIASLRLRGGMILGPALVYATGGVAMGDVEHSFFTQNAFNSFSEFGTKSRRWGPQLGAGVEARIFGPFTLGAEYLYTRLNDDDYTVHATGGGSAALTGLGFQTCAGCAGTDIKRSSDAYEINSLRVTAGFRF